MKTAMQSRPSVYRFSNLPSYTQEEVTLWNWLCRISPAHEEWSSWIAEIIGHLVQHPDGIQLRLVQSHALDPEFGEKDLSFGSKGELLIGRDAGNDVVLSAKAISKRHARLTVVDNRAYLEDLGGKLGTYLWDKRLPTAEPQRLSDGDQFSIFPYRFRVELERNWSPEKSIHLSKQVVQFVHARTFLGDTPLGWKLIVINSHPVDDQILLACNPIFMAELCQRVLESLGVSVMASGVPSDGAMFGFVMLALLERLNRRLKFPVQFSLARGESKWATNATRGLLVSSALSVGGLSSHVRVFLPLELLARCKPQGGIESQLVGPAGLCWSFPISLAFVELESDVMSQITLGDIVVTERKLQILFPNDFDKGWLLSEDPSNKSNFLIDKYCERNTAVGDEDGAPSNDTKPDLANLPVRLHVIVGQKEFSVAEINSLSAGTIVDLQSDAPDKVRLMVNGKILGEGELVEVDGKLGVKVLGWRSA